MKTINIKLLIIICLISIISILLPLTIVEAAGSFSINKGSASLEKGGTTTITVTASNCAGQFTVSSSNPSVATVSTSSIWLDNNGTPITITAKSAGTATITITATDVTDTDLNDITGSKTCSVTVTNPAPPPPANTGSSTTGGSTNNKPSTSGNNSKPSNSGSTNSKPGAGTTTTTTKPEEKKSNDSTLKGLVIEGYELYPAFAASTREYNLRVTNDITKIKVVPTVNYEKASYKIEGATEELIVGKNVITVVVTAEDGSTSNYVINVTRNREGLNVENIKLFYTDETGNKQELVLYPVFSSDVFEYTVDNLSHLINKLDFEVLANFEEAKIEITGNENLVEGENTITITVTMPSESEEEADEVLTYKIKVNKNAEPVVTLMGRIENWFNGITGTVSTWFSENVHEILTGSLIVCSFALGGLSVYLASAYKKYKLMLQKIAELTKINNAETISTTENTVGEPKTEIEPEIKPKGRHF